jgi:hypothetical protein
MASPDSRAPRPSSVPLPASQRGHAEPLTRRRREAEVRQTKPRPTVRVQHDGWTRLRNSRLQATRASTVRLGRYGANSLGGRIAG